MKTEGDVMFCKLCRNKDTILLADAKPDAFFFHAKPPCDALKNTAAYPTSPLYLDNFFAQ